MKRIIIVHGWSGSPEGNWIPWLKNELEKSGCEVIAPAMPDSDNPVIEKWVGCLAEVVGQPDEETYFVGHSIGCQTILRYFDRYNFGSEKAIGGAVFVAGWFNLENLEGEEIEIAKPWLETSLNIANIKAVLPKSTLIISDNDPYGAFEENKEKFEKLGAEIIVLHDAGHITAGDGFTEVPIILEEVLKF